MLHILKRVERESFCIGVEEHDYIKEGRKRNHEVEEHV